MSAQYMDYLLSKLQSSDADQRCEACEGLRKAPEITPEAVKALEIALLDSDEEVREAAKRALNTQPFKFSQTIEQPKITRSGSTPNSYNTPQRETLSTYNSSNSQAPGGFPNAPEYILGLEKRIMTLEVELHRISREIPEIHSLSRDALNKIPDSNLLSNDYLKRAFAVWGHYFVAQLIITIPLIILYFLLIGWIISLGN